MAEFTNVEEASQPPPPPPPPPPPAPPATPQAPQPPPRDVNPFGQPTSPQPSEEKGGGGGTFGGDDLGDPPAPKTPPPPVPKKTTEAAVAAEAAGAAGTAAAAAVAGEDVVAAAAVGEAQEASPAPPTSPPPPLPPQRPFSPLPAGEEGGVAAFSASVGAEALPPQALGRLTGRRKALDETRLFEQRRSHHFGDKFDGDSLYWKCFVELIRRSQANNRRAINYATQKLSANHAYARALYAIRDRVDGLEEGSTEKRCEQDRNNKKKGPREWPPQPLSLRPREFPQEHGGDAEAGAIARPANALDWLFMMEEHTAMRTLDMCDEAKASVIDKRLNAMVKSLDSRFSEMVGKGTACLRLMHSAESNSTKAYARYQDVVTASLDREAAPSGPRASLSSRDVVASDVWLADMNYRVAVTQQARVWKGVSAKLGELFAKMKDIEVERRQAIQGGLMALVQLQDALLRDLPALKDPVLQTLDRINVDRHLLDQEVRQEMRVGAARLLAHRHDGESGGGDRTAGNGGAPSGSVDAVVGRADAGDGSYSLPPDFLRSLESPLESSLIARSTMLERKEKMIIASRWVLVLAILTHDSYLLLFDVPRGCAVHKKQLNARTSEAFAELVPKPEVDAMAIELGKHKDGKGMDSGGLPIPPSVAVDLSACQVNFKPDGKSDATFEITEIKPARGMKGVFKAYEETRFTLRGRSQEAMVDWVCEIKEMGRVGMQAVSGGGK